MKYTIFERKEKSPFCNIGITRSHDRQIDEPILMSPLKRRKNQRAHRRCE